MRLHSRAGEGRCFLEIVKLEFETEDRGTCTTCTNRVGNEGSV